MADLAQRRALEANLAAWHRGGGARWEPLHIPFRVAVGATFDQQQIEEDGSSTTGPTSI
jgi:hypothetical protein